MRRMIKCVVFAVAMAVIIFLQSPETLRAQTCEELTNEELQNWTAEQKQRKRSADSIQAEAAELYSKSNFKAALHNWEKSLKIFNELGAKKEAGIVQGCMGIIYNILGIYQEALDDYQRALTIAREVEAKKEEGTILNRMGNIYDQRGDYPRALAYYQQALKNAKETGRRVTQAECSVYIGEIYFLFCNDALAMRNYREALEIASEIGVPMIIKEAQHGLGAVFERRGEYQEALRFYAQAIEAIESVYGRLKLESFKIGFMEEKITAYESAIELLIEMGRIGEAFNYAERAKGRVLLDILSIGQIDITEGISAELLTKSKDVERRMNKINEDLSKEHAVREPDTLLIMNLEDDLRETRAKHQKIMEEIKLNHPKYAELTGISRPLTLAEVQRKVLQRGAVLIEYFVGEDNTNVWAVGKDWFGHEKIELEREELENMVKELRRPFVDVKDGKIKNFVDISFDLELSRKLYRLIFQPIEKFTTQADYVVIVPDGILHYLPFEILVTEMADRRHDKKVVFSRYESATYLVERFPISYAPSASVLEPELIAKGKANKRGSLLAFGNPDFGRVREQQDQADDFDYLALLTRSSKGWMFRPLPQSEAEVKAVSDIMKPSSIYTKKRAKEEVFKEKAKQFSVIHLATHAIVEETQPLYSRIVFAQDDDPREDGFLQTFEVFNLELDADLVTLSACETGLGKLSRGEGLVGLTRAFMYAGTPSVLVSLWSVEESTSKLMRYFYQHVADGLSKTEALRQAKLRLIGMRDGGVSFAHPFLWAPFVLVGEYR